MNVDLKVPMPELAADAYLEIDFSGLEKLEEAFGPKWHSIVLEGLDTYRPSVIRKTLEIGLHGADRAKALDAVPPKDLALRLVDALYRMLQGKTLAEMSGAAS